MINHRHSVLNPNAHQGYGSDCWGLTASHGPRGYVAHAPDLDIGVISLRVPPCPAFPICPSSRCMPFAASLRGGNRIWGRFGFVDAFCENRNWYARTYLAINQGPIVAMIENHRSALLWNLFMRAPEARLGLARLGFSDYGMIIRVNASIVRRHTALPQRGRRMGTSPAWPNCAGDHTVHIPAIAVGRHSQKAKRDSNWCEEERHVGQAFEWNPAFRGRFPFIIHWANS